ncbi:MAG TPA: hypothetical protein VGF82_30245, partial [Terracidiphilus sp.]
YYLLALPHVSSWMGVFKNSCGRERHRRFYDLRASGSPLIPPVMLFHPGFEFGLSPGQSG